MNKATGNDLFSCLAGISDPRNDRAKRHQLMDILVIAVCGVICGAESWVDIEEFGKAKESWLRQFLALPSGIPSHDTFGRVFAQLKAEAFREAFLKWIRMVREVTRGEVIAVDGKTLRRSFNQQASKSAIHMVSAWAAKNRLVLGQVKTDEKSNEITAIPQLLKLLDIKGCIVTIDAMGCQKEIAETIVEAEGDYVLALKGNHETLYEEVKLYLDDAVKEGFPDVPHDDHQSVEKGHGRIETRRTWVTSDIGWIEDKTQWKGLRSIGLVESERLIEGQKTLQRRYYLSSLAAEAKPFAQAVRAHWGVENSLHWVLDMVFREDECRVRKDHAPENFAMLRHIALSLIKQNRTSKRSVKGKRLKAGWDHGFLEQVLFKN